MADLFKINHKVEKKSMVSLSVYNVGRQKCPPGYKWGPGVRDHFLIHHITEGSGIYRTNGKEFHLCAGDTFLAYPNTEILYQASDEKPWTYEWVGFNGTDAGPILERTDFSREQPFLKQAPYGDQIHEHLEKINGAFGMNYASVVAMTGELYLLLSVLAENASHLPPVKNSDAENVKHAIEYISARYSYAISIEDVARFVGVSRSTLFRQFRKEMNLSPKEYLDRYRIERALPLLTRTDLTVASVAASVGYDNGLYFSKVFKKLTDQTPSDYRKKAQTH